MARLAMIETPVGMEEYTKLKVNCSDEAHFLNIKTLENDIAFLVEGEWDAMSFYEADIECIALGSIVMVKKFVKVVIESQKRPKILIIAPDNDPKPETKKLVTEKVEYIKTELSKIGIYVHIANIAGDFKDVNNRLVDNREDFIKAVEQAKSEAVANKEKAFVERIENSPLINNCAFIKSVIFKKKISDDNIAKTALSLIWQCHSEPEEIIKKILLDWLGDDYTEDKLKEYIEHCKEAPKTITCSFIRNELGFTKCPVKDEVCNEIESPATWADLLDVSIVRKLTRELTEENVIDSFSKENCKIIDRVKKSEYEDVADKFLVKYARIAKSTKNDALKKIDKKLGRQNGLQKGDRVGEITTQLLIPSCPLNLSIPASFEFSEEGIKRDKDIGSHTPIIPVRFIRNADDKSEKYIIAYLDKIVELCDVGLNTSSSAAKVLSDYLFDIVSGNTKEIPEAEEYEQPGWRNDFSEFISPLTTYSTKYYFGTGIGSISSLMVKKGSLSEWILKAEEIRQSPYARACLDASFAAPLLGILGNRSFGLYIWGTSLYGKSASAKFAVSAWGDAERMMSSFNATANGLEAVAYRCNDILMVIDERQVANEKYLQLDQVVYKIMQGYGKSRMQKNTREQKQKEWRLVVLMNGENKLVSDGTTQGAISRVIEIHLNDDERIFENEFVAREVHQFAKKNCGYAGEKFINELLKHKDSDYKIVHDIYNDCLKLLKDYSKGKYLGEHLNNIAILMTADILVSMWFYGYDIEKAGDEAVAKLSNHLLGKLPSINDLSDAKRTWDFLMGWFSGKRQHFYGGTENDNEGNPRPPLDPIYGMIEPDYVYIEWQKLKKELNAAGYPANKVVKDWGFKNWIENDKDGYPPKITFNGARPRMLKIPASHFSLDISAQKNAQKNEEDE